MDVSLNCNLDQHLVGFSRYLRQQGLNVGVQETLAVLQAVHILSNPMESGIRTVTKSLFCNSKKEVDEFDDMFDSFWKGDSRRFRSHLTVSRQLRERENATASLIWLGGKGEGRESEDQSKEVRGANLQERLQRTDFTRLTETESELLEEIARKLWIEMSRRLSRRLKESSKTGQVNIRRTIRKNISSGGDPVNLTFKARKLQKPRLVIFLDVSGSMDKYSFYLLRFIHAIQQNFQQVESFLFSTRLHCITDILRRNNFSGQLKELTERARAWSSGTAMGACFQEFNRKFAKHTLSRKSIVIILSDGLDTGSTEDLREELQKISRRTHKLIWLNPLKGTTGYQPEAGGMRAAMPLVDVFASAHNLESLLDLENHLQDV